MKPKHAQELAAIADEIKSLNRRLDELQIDMGIVDMAVFNGVDWTFSIHLANTLKAIY
jgi:hypothetical protein